MGNPAFTARRSSRSSPALQGKAASIPPPETEDDLIAKPYWPRIPDGEYLAICARTYRDRKSRTYGERIYIYFRIFDGEHAGKELRMFCRPSIHLTSNYYRAWAIANNGPPRSRKTRLSPKVFEGKLFRVGVVTVKTRHRIRCPDGKVRQGNFLPEHLWYSKVECLLSLEVTNEPVADFLPKANGATPFAVTRIRSNPFQQREMARGGVGRRELGDGNWVREAGFSRWGGQSSNAPNPVGGEGHLAAGPAPIHSTTGEQASSGVAPPERRIGQCSRAQLERAIYRKHLFELYDNLPPKFDHKRRVDEMAQKAVRDLFMNRGHELDAVSEDDVLNAAQARLAQFSHFDAIGDYGKRRKVVVACVINAIVDAVLAAQRSKAEGRQ